MNYLFLFLGLLIFLRTICDLAYTTFSSNGVGYLTDALTKGLWRFSLYLCNHDGSKKWLEYVGIITIGMIVICWYLLLWLGSSLIFLSDPTSVVNATTYALAYTIEKVYYIGYTFTTMGNGDFSADGNIWQIFTVQLSFSGFMLITTAVSYMLPVLSADVAKKKISKKIQILGKNPQELLLNSYHQGSFQQIETYFADLMESIITHSQQLLAYPILYSFHAAHVEKSSSVSIAILDEALTILLLHVPEANRPSNQRIAPLRKAIATFLNVLDDNFTKDIKTEIFLPDLAMLEKAGVPLLTHQQAREDIYQTLSRRRNLIGVMLRNEGWKFSDIYKSVPDPEQEA